MMINKAVAPLINEEGLVNRAKDDLAAFEAVYDFYFAQVYNYVRYRVWDGQVADDLTSEIFETVLKKLHAYQPERGVFSAWLFAIARNTVNYHLRRQKIRHWFSLDQFHNHSDKTPTPDELIIKNEIQQKLLWAVSQLSQRERELIALKFTSGLTNRAISEMTGLKENHVAVILHRAVQRIRSLMDTDGRQL